MMGDDVTLVSSAEETAKDVYALLVREGLERDPRLPEPEHHFLTTGQAERLPGDRTAVPRTGARPRRPVRVGGRMRLTIIGCSGSFPGPESPASCYLVEAPYDGGRSGWCSTSAAGRWALCSVTPTSTRSTRSRCRISIPTTAWTCAATTSCASTTRPVRGRG